MLNSDVYTAVRTIADAGYEFIELWGEVPHAYHDRVDRRKLRDILSTYKIMTTMHAPFTDLNPATPFQPVKAAVEKTLVDFARFSRYLDARRITVHPGSVHSEALVPESVESAVTTLRKLVREADGGLEINIENQVRSQSPFHFPLGSNVESLDLLLSQASKARLTLDSGHAHVNGIDPLQLYRRFQDDVTEVHLSDNNGSLDEHLPPGLGTVNLKGLLEAVDNSDVFVCLELNPHRLTGAEVMEAASALKRKLSK